MTKRALIGCAVVLGLVGLVGCGGQKSDQDFCAMNPIAYGCGLQTISSAVAGGFKQTPSGFSPTGTYVCDGTLNNFFAVMLTEYASISFTTLHYWRTSFQPVDWQNPLPTRNGLKPKIAGSQYITMTPAMDGPYHVLYNQSAVSLYGLVGSAAADANQKPVIIPAYGIWIYAPNERPDYPTGVEVVTFDPDMSVPFVPGDGRCSSARVQMVSSL